MHRNPLLPQMAYLYNMMPFCGYLLLMALQAPQAMFGFGPDIAPTNSQPVPQTATMNTNPLDKLIFNGPTDAVITIKDDHCLLGIGSIEVNSVIGGLAPYSYSVDSINFVPGIIANLEAGIYRLYIKDANDSVLVKFPITLLNIGGPDSVSLMIDQPNCGGLTGSIHSVQVIGGSAPYQYSLNGFDYHADGNFSSVVLGTYQYYVRDNFGCIIKKPIQIAWTQLSGIALSPRDTTVCENETLTFRATTTGSTLSNIVWNIPAQGTTATLKVTQPQKIWISARDANNCLVSDTVLVRTKPCYPTQNCFTLPNAFTPNGDGRNDLFKPALNGCLFTTLRFRIYNRWGLLLFDTQQPGAGWDGSYNGLQQSAGGYIFTCNYSVEGGGSSFIKGSFMLVR